MAAGTAVVATRTEGAQELIDERETGLLVPIGGVSAIADSESELLGEADMRRTMGERAKEEANTRFSLKRMVDEIEKIYLATDLHR